MSTRKKILKNFFNQKGFSLVEILVTLGIFGIIMAIVTNIILINLKVARRVMARSYAREETSFMLDILKKDIRNADNVCDTGSGGSLIVTLVDDTYQWSQNGQRIKRQEVTIDANCVVLGTGEITYMTPGDIEVDPGDPLYFDVSCDENNCVVKIRVKAWTVGMPGSEEVYCGESGKQCIVKEVAVSTRNFE